MMVKDSIQFLREVKIELSKVVWPKFDEFVGSTLIVFLLISVFAIYLGLLDLGLSRLAKYIFGLYSGY
jgi:preprotein translocase subunit SecE